MTEARSHAPLTLSRSPELRRLRGGSAHGPATTHTRHGDAPRTAAFARIPAVSQQSSAGALTPRIVSRHPDASGHRCARSRATHLATPPTMQPPTALTARDLMALGYSRPTAYRMIARARSAQHVAGCPQVVTTTGSAPKRTRRGVLAVAVVM